MSLPKFTFAKSIQHATMHRNSETGRPALARVVSPPVVNATPWLKVQHLFWDCSPADIALTVLSLLFRSALGPARLKAIKGQ
jgi:hypothetical protein